MIHLHHRLTAALATGFVLAGCGAPAGMSPDFGVTVQMSLVVQDEAGRRLLGAVTPWVKADIDHVKLALFKGADANAVANVTIAKPDLAKTIAFTNLVRNTTYKVEAQAWSDAGETSRIDDLAGNAASCTTTFATTDVTPFDAGAIKLKLRDKTFAGGTTGSSLVVTDGVVSDTTTAEGITVQ